MSSLKNSPFGKRLRGPQLDSEDEPRRIRQRINPMFASSSASASTPSLLDSSRPTSSTSESLPSLSREPEYRDRFVPARDQGDLRTSFNLMDDGQPSTPCKRIIPTESDAIKGTHAPDHHTYRTILLIFVLEQANSIFVSMLHNEVTPPSPPRERSPVRPSSSSTNPTAPSTPSRKRLFSYHSPSGADTPSTPRKHGLDSPSSSAYNRSPVRPASRVLLESPRRTPRPVCKTPYRVLDAPELADDFYLNLVDWSSTNVLGVGLASSVYLWTAHNAQVAKLCDLGGEQDTVSSVSWVQKGSTVAVGTLRGRLHIFDATTQQLQRTYSSAHVGRVGALGWNSHILTSGSRDKTIAHRDVREPGMKPFARGMGHKQEVCGLTWSGDGGAHGATLASGGNDNKVCIWDLRGSRRASADAAATEGTAEEGGLPPLWKFHEHTAAVKALAWDPHVSGVLATGGGTQDKHIRFWNVLPGTAISALDTGSQVCSLVWSKNSHELVSTHGFSSTAPQNQICIWRYSDMSMVASLTGHTHRVLYLAMSPDGETIVTGAGDETLRFWNAFPKKEGEETRQSQLDFSALIR